MFSSVLRFFAAQVLWMVGARPVPDALGRVNKVEPVPLEELGRPRVDVVVNCSGVFRDLFINQVSERSMSRHCRRGPVSLPPFCH